MAEHHKHILAQSGLFAARLLLILLGILTFLFFLQRLSGDPAAVLAGHSTSAEVMEAIRDDMGLNDPVHVQYAVFLSKAVRLDFGDSNRFQQPAIDLVLDRLPNTLLLAVSALVLASVVGIPLGIYAAMRQYHMDGNFVNILAGVLQALPSFWLGLVLLLIFSVNLQWVGTTANLETNLFKKLALPTLTLSAFYTSRLIRLVRSGMIEEMGQHYVMAAHAKGLKRRTVNQHILRNTLIPVVAFLTLDLSFLVGGSVIVENLFAYNGIGDQLVKAILNRDFALVQATVFVIALLVVLINALSNTLYRLIDPRIAATN